MLVTSLHGDFEKVLDEAPTKTSITHATFLGTPENDHLNLTVARPFHVAAAR